MKFTITSPELRTALQSMEKAIPSKAALPILECVLIREKDGVYQMVASDTEITIEYDLDIVDVQGFFPIALGYEYMKKFIKDMIDEPIEISVDDNYACTIKTSEGLYDIVAYNGADFPVTLDGETGESLSISHALLSSKLNEIIKFAAEEEFRPQMSGVFIDFIAENKLVFVASDGHKLGKSENLVKGVTPGAGVIIGRKTASILDRLKGDIDELSFGDRVVKIVGNKWKLTARNIEGRFPNYNLVIPQNNEYKVTVNRTELDKKIKKVLEFANTTSLLRFGTGVKSIFSNEMTISAQDINFSTSAEIKLNVIDSTTPEGYCIGFNGEYLSNIVKSLTQEEITIEMSEPGRPLVIKEDVGTCITTMLLMPMMLNQ